MARCLVLGANGFIGSHLVDSLADQGHFVRCFDRYKSNINFTNHDHHDIEIFRGDFLNRDSLGKALEDIEYVFHFISTTNPFTAENDPLIDIETNVKMSVELFKICAQKSIKKIIFASTGGAIYGQVDSARPINEEVTQKPISPYAIGKLSIENYLRYFRKKYGLDYQVLRISNPYGPRQNTLSGQGVIPIFLEKIKSSEPLTIFGDGSMVRDYIYIKDAVDMIVGSFSIKSPNQVYNLASGHGSTVNDILDTIEAVTEIKASTVHKPVPSTFIDKIILDSDLFYQDFGLRSKTSLEEGIKLTWQNLQIHQ